MEYTTKTVYYSKKDIEDWKNKKLLHKWRKEYPSLIEDHYLQIWSNKNKLNSYGFGELYTAVYHTRKGYKFLYEPWLENFLLIPSVKLKDTYKKFSKTFIKYAGKKTYEFIQNKIASEIKKGQPDLFIYNEDECFFVEVKKKNDKLNKEQKLFINKLSNSKCSIPIVLVNLLEQN